MISSASRNVLCLRSLRAEPCAHHAGRRQQDAPGATALPRSEEVDIEQNVVVQLASRRERSRANTFYGPDQELLEQILSVGWRASSQPSFRAASPGSCQATR